MNYNNVNKNFQILNYKFTSNEKWRIVYNVFLNDLVNVLIIIIF